MRNFSPECVDGSSQIYLHLCRYVIELAMDNSSIGIVVCLIQNLVKGNTKPITRQATIESIIIQKIVTLVVD